MPLPALMYQGGYLTIKKIIDANTFRLGIPNEEIANSLSDRAAFAAVPHEWKVVSENEAQRYFLLFLRMIGADVSGEVPSRDSRKAGAEGLWSRRWTPVFRRGAIGAWSCRRAT